MLSGKMGSDLFSHPRMDRRQINSESHFEEDIDDPDDWQSVSDPIVTVDRKKAVAGYFVVACVLGFIVFASTLTLFRHRAFRDIDGFMFMFLGITLSCVCAVSAIWIRARWICVAVLDNTGVIASTLAGKYDLQWSEIIGARSYTKILKDSNKVQGRVLLLLDESRCLEAPISTDQLHTLFQILLAVKFKPESQGQSLGTTKGLTLSLLGIAAMAIGSWWAFHILNQFNNGVLFQGNAKAIVFKIAAGSLVPIGGLISVVWGIYHTIAKPVLYKPGYFP